MTDRLAAKVWFGRKFKNHRLGIIRTRQVKDRVPGYLIALETVGGYTGQFTIFVDTFSRSPMASEAVGGHTGEIVKLVDTVTIITAPRVPLESPMASEAVGGHTGESV